VKLIWSTTCRKSRAWFCQNGRSSLPGRSGDAPAHGVRAL